MTDDFWADANALRHRAFGHGLYDGKEGGLSDQETARERRAQAIFFPALAGFQARVRDAAALSALMADVLRTLLDAIDDHAPGQERWDEMIAVERR